MKRKFRAALTFAAAIAMTSVSVAQDVPDLPEPGENVNEDYLDLTNPVLSIWPPVNTEGIAAINESLGKLISVYETESRDADASKRELKKLVDDAKKDEDVVKSRVDVAKKAGDEAEKARLEALKKTHEGRRKYLDRIRKIREQEQKVAKARLEYLKSLRETIGKATQLSAEREGDQNYGHLLAIEKEMIDSGKKTGKLNEKLASETKKLNSNREGAFNERAKIIEAMEEAEAAAASGELN